MTDLHIHTKFSSDSKEEMENHILKAIAMGKKKIGFSEHINLDFILHKFDYENTVNLDAYFAHIEKMRAKYKNQIEILFGGEIGFDGALVSDFRALIEKYHFDYVINSIHLVYGEDAWLAPFYENRTKKQVYDLYFDSVYDSVCADFPYKIVGHIGYVIRRMPFADKSMELSEFGDKIDKILLKIIEKNKILEVNTSTRGVCEILPLPHIIKRYVELGGTRFSYGSDAHDVSRLYENEEKAGKLLLSLGIKSTVCYRNGEEYFEPIAIANENCDV